jgi:hypothetical protein
MSNWISSGMGMGKGRIPTTDNIPETTEKLGCPTDNIPDSRFFKTLNLSYSFEIKQINERTNIYFKFYFKIMFLSHNIVVFIIKSKSKTFINSLKSAYNLAYISYILIDT